MFVNDSFQTIEPVIQSSLGFQNDPIHFTTLEPAPIQEK
jgi:hypothetical protein